MKAIQILGPFNSGTNLLTQLLKNNLSKNVELHLEGHTKIWKHSLDMGKINDIINDKDNIVVIIYRDYYTWIKSTKNNKYDLIFESIDGETKFHEKKYKNTVEVYNNYYNNYISLTKHNNVIWVDYYKLLEKDGFKYLNKKLSKLNLSLLSEKKYKDTLNQPSKSGVNLANNSQEAINKREHNYQKMKKRCKELALFPDKNIKKHFK
jgi:hypothetical protein